MTSWAPTALPCGCKLGATITDPAAHDRWHALVVEQGGPPGPVDAVTLRRARGLGVLLLGTPAERRERFRWLRRTGLVLD